MAWTVETVGWEYVNMSRLVWTVAMTCERVVRCSLINRALTGSLSVGTIGTAVAMRAGSSRG